jgi:hypothetical protein
VPQLVSSRVVRLSLVLMVCLIVVYTMVLAPSAVYYAIRTGVVSKSLIEILIGMFFMALNVPLAFPFANNIRLGRRRTLNAAGWLVAMIALQVVAVKAQGYPLRVLFPVSIIMDSATALGLLLAVIAILHHDDATRKRLRAQQLQALVRDEEMKALMAQLHPHFLFNTLNAILALMRCDRDAARITLRQLRTLIEQHIDSYEPLWTVGEEMHVVSTYLDIEQRRFGDRLHIDVEVAPEARLSRFPRLLLQPLVENAVRHGARGGGTVSIRLGLFGTELHAEVADSGTFKQQPESGAGVGLSNTRSRLELLYSGRYRLDIVPAEHGTRIELEIPAER